MIELTLVEYAKWPALVRARLPGVLRGEHAECADSDAAAVYLENGALRVQTADDPRRLELPALSTTFLMAPVHLGGLRAMAGCSGCSGCALAGVPRETPGGMVVTDDFCGDCPRRAGR